MDELFEELLDFVPTLFRADIKAFPGHLLATAGLGDHVLDVIAEECGKDKAEEFKKNVEEAVDKHDLKGLLDGIIDEFNRVCGHENGIKVDVAEMRRQLDEDE